MNFLFACTILTALICQMKCEEQYPVTHDQHIKSFHHGGQHHSVQGSPSGSNSGIVPSPSVSSSIQDQQQASVIPQDQVQHSSQHPSGFVLGPGGSSLVPQPSKYDVLNIGHLGGRAIGVPYYPNSYGKAYASPYYNQYQPVPYQGGLGSGIGGGSYVYSPYSAAPYSQVTPYSATPYSAPVVPYSGYPSYNYPAYVPYYSPSAYYQQPYQPSGEVNGAVKQ